MVKYKGRFVSVVKIPCVIGENRETKEKYEGFIYLCKDMQNAHRKIADVLSSKVGKNMSREELSIAIERLGIFAIVSTKDLPEVEILPEYYSRQTVEQYFDFSKNYSKLDPIRCHTEETIRGHVLLSFIATFLTIIIKNKLKYLDINYVARDSSVDSDGK